MKNPKRLQGERLPGFLYENRGRVMAAELGDDDVTKEYKSYLSSIGKCADNLPSFLYESGERIFMGALDDCDVTDAWREWVGTLKPTRPEST